MARERMRVLICGSFAAFGVLVAAKLADASFLPGPLDTADVVVLASDAEAIEASMTGARGRGDASIFSARLMPRELAPGVRRRETLCLTQPMTSDELCSNGPPSSLTSTARAREPRSTPGRTKFADDGDLTSYAARLTWQTDGTRRNNLGGRTTP